MNLKEFIINNKMILRLTMLLCVVSTVILPLLNLVSISDNPILMILFGGLSLGLDLIKVFLSALIFFMISNRIRIKTIPVILIYICLVYVSFTSGGNYLNQQVLTKANSITKSDEKTIQKNGNIKMFTDEKDKKQVLRNQYQDQYNKENIQNKESILNIDKEIAAIQVELKQYAGKENIYSNTIQTKKDVIKSKEQQKLLLLTGEKLDSYKLMLKLDDDIKILEAKILEEQNKDTTKKTGYETSINIGKFKLSFLETTVIIVHS
jgi:hypothetical protein